MLTISWADFEEGLRRQQLGLDNSFEDGESEQLEDADDGLESIEHDPEPGRGQRGVQGGGVAEAVGAPPGGSCGRQAQR